MIITLLKLGLRALTYQGYNEVYCEAPFLRGRGLTNFDIYRFRCIFLLEKNLGSENDYSSVYATQSTHTPKNKCLDGKNKKGFPPLDFFYILKIFRQYINLDIAEPKFRFRDTNWVVNPKKPQFRRILAIFSPFLAKISAFPIFFFHGIFQEVTCSIVIDITFTKIGMRNPNGVSNHA